MYSKHKIDSLLQAAPILQEIIDAKPVSWLNPDLQLMKDVPKFPLDLDQMIEAEQLWKRFAPFFVKAFPENAKSHGILESPLREISKMKAVLNSNVDQIQGRLFLKCDNELVLTPIKQEYYSKFRLSITRLIFSLKLDVYQSSIFP